MNRRKLSNEREIRVRRRPDRHCFAHAQGGLLSSGHSVGNLPVEIQRALNAVFATLIA